MIMVKIINSRILETGVVYGAGVVAAGSGSAPAVHPSPRAGPARPRSPGRATRARPAAPPGRRPVPLAPLVVMWPQAVHGGGRAGGHKAHSSANSVIETVKCDIA